MATDRSGYRRLTRLFVPTKTESGHRLYDSIPRRKSQYRLTVLGGVQAAELVLSAQTFEQPSRETALLVGFDQELEANEEPEHVEERVRNLQQNELTGVTDCIYVGHDEKSVSKSIVYLTHDHSAALSVLLERWQSRTNGWFGRLVTTFTTRTPASSFRGHVVLETQRLFSFGR
jgi:hypothetical protein